MPPPFAPIVRELAAILEGLPDRDRLLRWAFEDLDGPDWGIPFEDKVRWWRMVLEAYRADPRPEVVQGILDGEVG